jgi:hypothetical protein
MTNTDDEGLGEFGQHVKALFEEVMQQIAREPIAYQFRPRSAKNPHVRIILHVRGVKRAFQIDEEDRLAGDGHIREKIRNHLAYALSDT